MNYRLLVHQWLLVNFHNILRSSTSAHSTGENLKQGDMTFGMEFSTMTVTEGGYVFAVSYTPTVIQSKFLHFNIEEDRNMPHLKIPV